MARIRTIKPEFFTSETIASLPVAARLTFIGLWTQADDHGRLVDNSRIIKGALWPLDDDVTPADVSLHIHMLVDAGMLERYEVDGKRYLLILGWHHQRINRKSEPRHPAPPSQSTADSEPSLSPHAHRTEDGPQEQGTGNRESLSSSRTARTRTEARSSNEEERGIEALKILGTRLARSANKPDGYAVTVVKNAIQLPELIDLARSHPTDTATELVDRYQSTQTNGHDPAAPPKPRCTICQSTSHTADRCILREEP